MNLKNLKSKTLGMLGLLTASFVALPAFAADDISTGAVTAITGAGPQVTAVVVALVGVLGILIAWTLIRKAMGK